MKRVKLRFAGELETMFADRDLALKRIREWGERGTRFPQVVFGPEGCGKSSWLRQSIEALKEMNYDIIYINPIEKILATEIEIASIREYLMNRIIEIIKEDKWGLLVNIVIDLVRETIKLGRGKIAILVDEAFHVIGYEKSALYVKALLGVIEYPPASYEKIIAVVATSEGLSREEIGRHLWAEIRPMWNMSEEGFKELYEQIPGDKPSYEDIWRVTGGNPRVLGMLYSARWSTEEVVRRLIIEKKLNEFISGLAENEKRLLREALDDPDVLMSREGIPLMKKLVKANLIVDEIPERDHGLWIDAPPPERDTDLGIGRYVAWQTPLHKEAVKRVLKIF